MGNVSFSTQSMPAFAYPHAIKPYIGVPNEFLNAVVQNHNAKLDPTTQKYMVDCREAFEPFEIHTENSAYVVESRHFIIRHDQNDMQCELALRRRQSDFAEPVVLGIPFFHQYCVTLEPRHAQISFAPII
ncbi:unnamed protein product [Litomosoides sigmodontis]|uniref:Peptidase A1 domain-containing protein n=1 Tax=Litomosoides sigmodontis TaxID=42156 RepID=A0A3P7JMI7_LITSI|nr:unnamed protein product [Litomosoides sigmodontis]